MNNNLDQSIEQVLDVLADNKASGKLVKTIREQYDFLFVYLNEAYGKDFTPEEFQHLEYGVFLICAVLFKQSETANIEMEDFIAAEENMYKFIEENKTIQPYFTSISIMDPKVALYDLVEEYYHTMEEEGVSGISRNIIACVMSALI